jgi:hypothetical protein
MWNKIKPYIPKNIIECLFYMLIFSILTAVFFDSSIAHYAAMLGGAALYTSIRTERELRNRKDK